MRAFLLAPVALAAAAAATQLEQRSPFHAIRSSLVTRADVIDPAIIPKECKSACSNTVSDLNGCGSMDCLCTNSNGRQLNQCVDCLVKAGAPIATGQSTLNTFVDACLDDGFPVDSLTVGGSGGGGGSGSSGSSNIINSIGSAPHLVASRGTLLATLAGVVGYLL